MSSNEMVNTYEKAAVTYQSAAEVTATYARAQAQEQARLAAEREAVRELFELVNRELREAKA